MDPGRLADLLADGSTHLDRVVAAVASVGDDFPGEAVIVEHLDRLADDTPADERELVAHVFGALGFRGNTERYYAASNSLIHHVLDRRIGNPLSLAVVASEIGRRCGVELPLVGMPGHVLLGSGTGRGWFDPFAGGRDMDLDDCEAVFCRLFPDQAFVADCLEPMDAGSVAARMLQNLRVAYLRVGDVAKLARVLRLRVQLPNQHIRDRVDLANVLGSLGRFDEAAVEHDLLAQLVPEDAEKHEMAALRQRARNN